AARGRPGRLGLRGPAQPGAGRRAGGRPAHRRQIVAIISPHLCDASRQTQARSCNLGGLKPDRISAIPQEQGMKLSSLSFSDSEAIPERYAFGKIDPQSHVALADNCNPQFAWDDVPEGTRSFALICHDPDVPSKPDDVNQEGREVPADLPRVDFFHWVLIDLPADKRDIQEGDFSSGITPRGKGGPLAPGDARQGINDYTSWFAADRDMSGDYFGY